MENKEKSSEIYKEETNKEPNSSNKVQDVNTVKCFGGTINHIEGFRIKMFSISGEGEKDENGLQSLKAQIKLDPKRFENIEIGKQIVLSEEVSIEAVDIQPYNSTFRGYVEFRVIKN
jgi:hypothetical protein